jgi:hypothetical protein
VSFTIQRFLGIATVMVLGLLLLTPAPGLAQLPRPDLVVNSLSPPPTDAFPGDSFVVTASVKNQGPGAAGTSVTKFFLVPSREQEEPQGRSEHRWSPGQWSQRRAPATVQIYSDTAPERIPSRPAPTAPRPCWKWPTG